MEIDCDKLEVDTTDGQKRQHCSHWLAGSITVQSKLCVWLHWQTIYEDWLEVAIY
jgi:hypothetical protein